MHYYYDIYVNNVCLKSVDDLDYATYYLLTNKNSYYIIYSYSINKDCSIPEGCIKIINNKVVKIIDDIYVSYYSPYDLYLFKRSDLSKLYLNFYTNNIDNIDNINDITKNISNKQQNILINLNKDNTQTNLNKENINKDNIQNMSQNELNEFKNILNDLTDMNKKITNIK